MLSITIPLVPGYIFIPVCRVTDYPHTHTMLFQGNPGYAAKLDPEHPNGHLPVSINEYFIEQRGRDNNST